MTRKAVRGSFPFSSFILPPSSFASAPMDRAKVVDFIGRVPVVGETLRKFARRYPEGSVVEIRTGVAAGLRWKRHHRYLNGYWVGHFELEIQNALQREIKAGDAVYDVGANAGFF